MELKPLDTTAGPVCNHGSHHFYVRGITPQPDGSFFAWESWHPAAPELGWNPIPHAGDKNLRVDIRAFYDLNRRIYTDKNGERRMSDQEIRFFT